DPGDLQTQRLQHLAVEVRRGRLALPVRVGRKNHFGNGAVSETFAQPRDAEIVRADTVDGADRAAEYVVLAAVRTGALDRQDVLGFLDDADDVRVPTHAAADAPLLLLGDVAADRAEPDLLGERDEPLGKPLGVRRVPGEHVERDPLRALRADAGQPAQLVDE